MFRCCIWRLSYGTMTAKAIIIFLNHLHDPGVPTFWATLAVKDDAGRQ